MAKAELFIWNGQNERWEESQNWLVDGVEATSIPGESDMVIFMDNAPQKTVRIRQVHRINSLHVIGEDAFHFTFSGKGKLWIDGNLVLNASSSLERGIGLASESPALLTSTESQLRSVEFAEERHRNNYSSAPQNSSRGSCPFFNIVPDVTNPTCNGFNDGIAGVEEPADGIGPYTYQWVGGPNTQYWTGVGAGTYTVIIIDQGAGGLPCSEDIFVNEPGPLTVFSMNGVAPICFGDCNGQAAPVVIGGNGGYEYSWSSGESGPTASALCSTFTLEIEDQLGCQFSTDFTFPDSPEEIIISADVQDVACAEAGDGSISLSISGGVGVLSISWSGPNGFASSSSDIDNLMPGAYSVMVTDENDCTGEGSYTISEPSALSVSASIDDNECPGESNGAISLSSSGGTPPYSYAWTGPDGFTSTEANIDNLLSGSYTVLITDDNGCELSEDYEVDQPDEISLDLSTTEPLCFGDNSGSISVIPGGGQAPYSFSWMGPNGFTASSADISGLLAGSYELMVSDAGGCSNTETIDLGQPDSLSVSFSSNDPQCAGGSDGSITATAGGGTAPYSYAWTGPEGFSSSDPNIENLTAGSYTLNLVDANGCPLTESISLEDPEGISISASLSEPTCSGGSNGSISIEVSGGNEPYIFAWTGPAGFSSSNQNLSNLAAGTYNLTVSDDSDCESTATYILDAPDNLDAAFNIEDVSCFDGNDGSISPVVSGGTGPYSFLWIGPGGFFSTQQNIENLIAGSYTLQIADANSCTGFFEAVVNQNNQINITRTLTQVTCFGGSDGAINIVVSGGNGPYTFAWSGPEGFSSSSQNISGLIAGSYTVIVTDAEDCTESRNYTITEPAEIIVEGDVNTVVCAGDSDGSINLSITSGSGPFSYAWSGPGGFSASTQNISGLPTGTYTVIVGNPAGCQGSESFLIEESNPIVISLDVDNLSCSDAADGSILVQITGGEAPFDFSWTGPDGFGSTDSELIGLEAGVYQLTLTDSFGCTVEDEATVESPAELQLNLDIADITCNGAMDGAINSVLSGGTAPYSYAWTGPDDFTSSDAQLSNLQEGFYELSVVDSQGCTISGSGTVNDPALLEVSIDAIQPECLVNNGELTAVVSGGTVADDYNYQWFANGATPVGNNQSISNLSPGEYSVTVSDDQGCEAEASIELLRDSFNLSASVSNVSCLGDEDGAIVVNTVGGSSPFTFTWTGPNGFAASSNSLSDLAPGVYQLQVEDNAGCIINESYDVEEPDALSISSTVAPETCAEAANGSIALTVSGGSPGYLYAWTGPDGFTNAASSASGLIAGIYDISVTDINACQTSISVEVELDLEIEIDLTPSSPTCFGLSDGSIETNISGGQAPYNYTWSGPNGFSSSAPSLENLEAGIYQLSIEDAAGCNAEVSAELLEPAELIIDVVVIGSTCLEANGSAEATATGGTGELSYSWTDADGTQLSTEPSLTDVVAGVYTLVVSDESACSEIVEVAISDSNGSLDGEISPASCHDAADGSINVSVIDGEPPFSYQWTGPNGFTSDQSDLTELLPGIYLLSVSDANDCLYAEEFVVSAPAALSAEAELSDAGCEENDGTINLNISGGTAPYTITWTGPEAFVSNDFNLSDLIPGDYNYLIEDAQMCALSGELELGIRPEIEVEGSVEELNCGADGAITIAVSGGLPPYSYAWIGPDAFEASSANIDQLEAGIYNLTVSDASGCEADFEFELQDIDLLSVSIESTLPDCGEENGSLFASIEGGVEGGGYFINWFSGSSDNLGGNNPLENLAPGNYSVLVIDDLGCEATASITLENPGISVSSSVSPPSCVGSSDASIVLEIISDNPPFTVSWVGPNGFESNESDPSDLSAGSYTYTVTAADGCSFSDEVEITDPAPISVEASVGDPCFSESNGSISLSIENAAPEVSVSWQGPDGFEASGELISMLLPGIYSYSISDGNGCTAQGEIELEELPAISLDLSVSNPLCFGEASGSIAIEASGGSGGFIYLWTGPEGFSSDQASPDNLLAGNYQLILVDEAGCEAIAGVDLFQPDSLEAIIQLSIPDCENLEAGANLAIIADGGTEPYSVLWSGPDGFSSDEFVIAGLSEGTFTYVLSDGNGCELGDAVSIPELAEISIELESIQVSCAGDTDGSVAATLSGGIGSLDFNWTGPDGFSSDQLLNEGLAPGVYTFSASDSLGCTAESSIEIGAPEALQTELLSAVDANCNTSEDGSIDLALSGGTAPYSIDWEGPDGFSAQGESIDNLAPGTYQASIEDAAGCQSSFEVEIDFTLLIEAEAGSDLVWCQSDLPEILLGSASGAEEAWWLSIEGDTIGGIADALIDNLEPGLYTFILNVSNGICTDVDSLDIEILSNPEVDAGEDREVFPEETFTLGGSPTAAAAVTYQWSPMAGGSFDPGAPNPSGFIEESTTFSVIVVDDQGCVGRDSVRITVRPTVIISSGFTPNDDGVNDLWIIDNIELFPDNFVRIFNRWGTLLYERRNYHSGNAWDGRYEGKALPVGTYYYTIELNDPRFPEAFTGPVTIYR